jgi:D-glycero-D-manno-heptose 1,7-bisphosphate phosphatase
MHTTAIFLDRDGVINEVHRGKWINSAADFKLYPYTIEALQIASRLNVPIFIITNQSGVHLGKLPHHEYYAMTAKMLDEFEANGIKIARVYECLHGKDPVACKCRKPGTLMLEKACREYEISTGRIWVVGDMATDIEMAINMHKVFDGYYQVDPIMVTSGLCNDDELGRAVSLIEGVGGNLYIDPDLLRACQRIYSSG